MYFFGFILFLLAQRAFELMVARRHEKELKNRGGREVDVNGYRVIVGMHSAFFVSLILEKVALDRPLNPEWSILLAVFFAAQLLRYWAI